MIPSVMPDDTALLLTRGAREEDVRADPRRSPRRVSLGAGIFGGVVGGEVTRLPGRPRKSGC